MMKSITTLLLLAKLTPLKAALPVLPSESKAFTRMLIARIENHLSGAGALLGGQPVGASLP